MIERFNEEIYNRHNAEVLDELVAEDISHHAPIPTPQGKEGFKQFMTGFWEAFPDASSTTEDLIVDGDEVAIRYTMRGTHQGEFAGVPATGNRVEVLASASTASSTDRSPRSGPAPT